MITHIRKRTEEGNPRALCGSIKRFLYMEEVATASFFSQVEICETCIEHPDYALFVLAEAGREEPPRRFGFGKSTCIGRNA